MIAGPSALFPADLDYAGDGLSNLMCSLMDGLGGPPPPQPALRILPPDRVAAARNVVLILIDGMGFNFFKRNAGPLAEHLLGSMSSVFPTSTAPAITTLMTGVPPNRHGATGWFMHFKELGTVGMILPFKPRWGGVTFDQAGIEPNMLLGAPGLFDSLPVRSTLLQPRELVDSPYSRNLGGRARRLGFGPFSECLENITEIVRTGSGRQYVYAYWPRLDGLAHRNGIDSAATSHHLADLEQMLGAWWNTLTGTDTLVLITADHGFVDTSAAETVWVDQHPVLQKALAQPLSGEPRVAYCQVRAGHAASFEDYVQTHLSDAVDLHHSQTLLDQGWFGLGVPDHRVQDRIGDYALVAKGRHVIKDTLYNGGTRSDIGVHGGISEDELRVPLLAVAP